MRIRIGLSLTVSIMTLLLLMGAVTARKAGGQTAPSGQQNAAPAIERSVSLSGRVVREDGTPPPEPAGIERVCKGMVQMGARTDSQGRFSFQLGPGDGEQAGLTTRQVSDLPADRGNYLSVAGLTPGVVGDSTTSSAAGGSRLGGARQNSIMMDGVAVMDTGNNGQMMGTNMEAIEQVNVSTPVNQAQYGRAAGAALAAMTRSGVQTQDLQGCEIRASLAGYTSDAIPLSGRGSRDNLELSRIVLHRVGNVEGTTTSVTSLYAPKDAQKAFDKGRDALKKEKWAEGQKQLKKAVALYPRYAAAWFELGMALEKSGNAAKAREAYTKAVESDPKYVNPYLQLASIAARGTDWRQVAGTAAQVLKLDPYNYPNIYLYDAIAEYNLHRLDDAEKSAREVLKLDQQNRLPAANHILGVILAGKGDFAAAIGYLQTYLKLAPSASDVPQVEKQLAEIEKLAQANPAR